MKSFFERYSYDSVRMALNQFATAIFGVSLAMTASKMENTVLKLAASIGAIVFYLMLNYGVAWRAGSKDKGRVDRGDIAYRPLTGLWISLIANSVNLLLAVLLTVGVFTGVANLQFIPQLIAYLTQGMYHGVLNSVFGGTAAPWWAFFLLPVPSLIVSLVGYIAGVKDFHITRLSIPDLPESDRPSRQEKREMRKEIKAQKENQDKK